MAADAGEVLVFSGANGAFVRRITDSGGASSDYLGYAVARLADVTGDGTSEILAAAIYDDTPQGGNAGSVIIFNGATGALVRKLTDTGGAASDNLGFVVAGAPDLNGDGTADVVAGAADDDTAQGAGHGIGGRLQRRRRHGPAKADRCGRVGQATRWAGASPFPSIRRRTASRTSSRVR